MTDKNQIPVKNVGVTEAPGEQADLPNVSRRAFFKRTALAGAGLVAAGGASFAAARSALHGSPKKAGIETSPDFKPFDQRDLILTFSTSKALQKQYPERNEMHRKYIEPGYDYYERFMQFENNLPYDNERPGYTQADRALMHSAWYPLMVAKSREQCVALPNTPMHSWDQSDVEPEQYNFGSGKRAATMIKSAARVFGAQRCGIAKFDKRFVYNPMYDQQRERTLTWEDDFPFEPKSVIVIMLPMDYDNYATQPAWTAEGATGNGYVDMSKVTCQLAKFVRGMGYNAVGAGNDLGNSVAFAILAGLGEGARNGSCIAPGVGPRVRLAKVFTSIDFGDGYDEPHSWGIEEFCESCSKCAEACPPQCISYEKKPTFEPTYEHADVPGYTWNSHSGIKKWHTDSKKCVDFWMKNDASCGNCVATCTYNEPDFWHHWMIMAFAPGMPKFLHTPISMAHPLFGYGGQGEVPIASKVHKFWESGEGMRTNLSSKNHMGNTGKA